MTNVKYPKMSNGVNRKIILGILTFLVIGFFAVAMYNADVVFGKARSSAKPGSNNLEELFLSQLPEELRTQVLEAKKTKNPLEALLEAARKAGAVTE